MTTGHLCGARNFSAGCKSTPVITGPDGGFFGVRAAAGDNGNNPYATTTAPTNLKYPTILTPPERIVFGTNDAAIIAAAGSVAVNRGTDRIFPGICASGRARRRQSRVARRPRQTKTTENVSVPRLPVLVHPSSSTASSVL